MKIFIILVSIMSMAITVGWLIRKHDSAANRLPWRLKMNILVTSLVTGIAVYFSLLLLALTWMTFK